MNNTNNNSSSIGILSLLGLIFIILKLTGYITWNWWLVTLPFWGGLIIAIIVYILIILMVWLNNK